MFERIADLPTGIDGVRASGHLSREDYQTVMEPLIDAARRDGRRLRLLVDIGPGFKGFSPGAAWEDAKLGLSNIRLFEGVAVQTDISWIRESMRFASFIGHGPVKVFAYADRAAAVTWLESLSDRVAVSQRLIPETGVLVVDVTQALRAQDFDAIALTADIWIEAHGRLNGLVIHLRTFPGWENLDALFRHFRFVRDHQRKVTHLAIAADGAIANIVPHFAEHFVKAEVKVFDYDALDAAIAWAGGSA